MKKYLILPTAVLTAFAFATSAFAVTEVKTKVDSENNVKVTINTDKSGEQVYTVTVMKPGESLSSNTSGGSVSNVLKFETIKGEGKAEVSFKLGAGAEAGIYEVTVGGGELDGEVSKFAVSAASELSAALAELLAANEANVETVLAKYNNKAWVVDLSDSTYTADRTNINKSIVTMAKDGAKSSGEVEALFENAVALSKIQNASKDDFLDLLKFYEEDLGMTYTTELMSGDESIKNAYGYLSADKATNPVNSAEDLSALLEKTEALGKVNSATRKNLQEVIEKYHKTLNVDIDGDYKNLDKYEIIKLLIKEEGDYKTIKEFSDAFDAAVAAVLAQQNTPVYPSGGGSGGSGGGSGGSGGGGGGSSSGGGNSFGITPSINVTDPGSVVGTKGESQTSEYFGDVAADSWAVRYIDYAAKKGYMSGDGNGSFRPEDKITREEFLKTILSAFEITGDEVRQKAEVKFGDVSEDDWFFDYTELGLYYGIINGISEESFGTGRYLTRQDAAVILLRARETAKLVLKDAEEKVEFSDGEEIADYAKDAVAKLQTAGVIKGYEDGSFCPNGEITRAEAAKMVYSVLSGANKL